MTTKIATGIETQTWYEIIASLKAKGWSVLSEYDEFDKGIDYDECVLQLDNERIEFIWDNWFEGEIRCSNKTMSWLEAQFNISFVFGKSTHFR